MANLAIAPGIPAPALQLTDQRRLADELGLFGHWVGPRTGPDRRNTAQREDYVLRRIIVAWKYAGRLMLPLEVRRGRPDEHEPDFVLRLPDGTELGVEITEAGAEQYQRELTQRERRGFASSDAAQSSRAVSSDEAVDDYVRAVTEKVAKFAQRYAATPECDLVVYDNTASAGFLNKPGLFSELRARNPNRDAFRHVHFVCGSFVYLDVLGSQPLVPVHLHDKYEIDLQAWLLRQAELLTQHHADLDYDNLADEIASMARRDASSFRSALANLLLHLLKWQFQHKRQTPSWKKSILNARDTLDDLEEESPSFASPERWEEMLRRAYQKARRRAANETGLEIDVFPEQCPYSRQEIRDHGFLPDDHAA